MKKLFLPILTILLSISGLYAQDFKGSFDLQATSQFKNGNVRSDTVSYFFDADKTAIIIHAKRNQPDLRMIFDHTQKTITALFTNNGKKGGYVLPMNKQYWPGLPQSKPDFKTGNNATVSATGNTKTIEGYTCREISAETNDYFFTLWVTDEINLSMTQVLSYQSVGKGKSKKEVDLYSSLGINGLPLEMQLKSRTGKADVLITLSNFKETANPEIFSTAGHEIFEVEQ